MDNITTIDELVKYDQQIQKMAFAITKNDDLASEIKQEFYMAYMKKQPLLINRFYIWAALNNQFVTYIRKEKVRHNYIKDLNMSEEDINEEYNYDEDQLQTNKETNLYNIINSHKFFDKELFKLNKIQKLSVKKISQETQIPEKTIRFAVNKVNKDIISKKDKI